MYLSPMKYQIINKKCIKKIEIKKKEDSIQG